MNDSRSLAIDRMTDWDEPLSFDDSAVDRAFNPDQPRGFGGKWIKTEFLHKAVDGIREAIKGSSTSVDRRGVHVTAPVRGERVTVTLSPLDIASLALLAVPGPDTFAAGTTGLKVALVIRQVRRALQLASAAQTAAQVAHEPARSYTVGDLLDDETDDEDLEDEDDLEFLDDESDEAGRALLDAIDDAISRAYNPDQARIEKGHVGAGRFGSKLTDVLEAWLRGEGPNDPLAGVARPTILKAAKDRGVHVPPRMSLPALKSALLESVREEHLTGVHPTLPDAGHRRFSIDHNGKRIDVGVSGLKSTRQVYVHRESDSGRRGARVTPNFAHMGEMSDWARQNGHHELADYAAAEHASKPAAPNAPAVGKDLIATSASKSATQAMDEIYSDPSADGMLTSLAAQQGFNGKPTTVSSQEMDRFVASGAPEMFRGQAAADTDAGPRSAADINEQFRSGSAHYGTGEFGNGYYLTNTHSVAASDYSDGTPGSVLRLAVKPDARHVEYDDLVKEQQAYLASLPDHAYQERVVFSDPGRYATARGYDIVDLPKGPLPTDTERWHLALNRTALYAEAAPTVKAKKLSQTQVQSLPEEDLVAAVADGRATKGQAVKALTEIMTIQSRSLSQRSFNVNDPKWNAADGGFVEKNTQKIYADYKRNKQIMAELGGKWNEAEPWERPLSELTPKADAEKVAEKATPSVPKARSVNGVDVSRMDTHGWKPNDPQVTQIADVAQRYGFTDLKVDGRGFAAAVDDKSPDTLLIGPKSKWTPEGWAAERARAGGKYYMAEADHASPAEYLIAHEAAHRFHEQHHSDYKAVTEALAGYARQHNIQKVDEFGTHGAVGAKVPITAADLDNYGDPAALKAFRDAGMSVYGTQNIGEFVGEAHAAYALGRRDSLMETVAKAEGWPSGGLGHAATVATKKTAPRAPASTKATLSDIRNAASRADAETLLKPHSKAELQGLAKELNVPFTSRATKPTLTAMILDEIGHGESARPGDDTVQVWDVEHNRPLTVPRGEAAAGMGRYAKSLGLGTPASGVAMQHAVATARGPNPDSPARHAEVDSAVVDAFHNALKVPNRDTRHFGAMGGVDMTQLRAQLDKEAHQVEVENKIRAAYSALLARKPNQNNRWAMLSDLRDEMGPGVDRREVDAALTRLAVSRGPGDANVIPESNQKALTAAHRAGAVHFGGQDKHAISFDDPSPQPVPPTYTRAEVDAALTRLNRQGSISLLPQENQKTLTAKDRADAVLVGGRPYHALMATPRAKRSAEPDDDDAVRALGHDTTPGDDELHHYWTVGPGLAKWRGSPHEFTTLRDELVKHVPLEQADRMAAAWVHEVTGAWPGSDLHRVEEGDQPRGDRVGPG